MAYVVKEAPSTHDIWLSVSPRPLGLPISILATAKDLRVR